MASEGKQMPVYGLEEWDEDQLPQGGTRARGRSMTYHDLLSAVKETPGRWFKIVAFSNATGASNARRALERGDKLVPQGTFEYHSPRTQDGSGSLLFAKYVPEGDVVADEDDELDDDEDE